jgi:hypothetical protein
MKDRTDDESMLCSKVRRLTGWTAAVQFSYGGGRERDAQTDAGLLADYRRSSRPV